MGTSRTLLVAVLLALLLFPFASRAQTDEGVMLAQGRSHYQKGNYYFASTWLERALKAYPNSPQREGVLLLISKSYLATGRNEKALQAVQTLLRDYPKAAAALDPGLLKLAGITPPNAAPIAADSVRPLPAEGKSAIQAEPVALTKLSTAEKIRVPAASISVAKPAAVATHAAETPRAAAIPPATQDPTKSVVQPHKLASAPPAPVYRPAPADAAAPRAVAPAQDPAVNPPKASASLPAPAASPTHLAAPAPASARKPRPVQMAGVAKGSAAAAKASTASTGAEPALPLSLAAPAPKPAPLRPVASPKMAADRSAQLRVYGAVPATPVSAPAAGTAARGGRGALNKAPESRAGYTLELGEYAAKTALAAAKRRLEKAGLLPVVEAGPKRKQPVTRLEVGEFADREAAGKMADKLRAVGAEHFILKDKAGRLHLYAGSYLEQEGADRERLRLEALGIKVHLKQVSVPLPTFVLRGGSFETERAAMEKVAELDRLGVRSVVVRKGP